MKFWSLPIIFVLIFIAIALVACSKSDIPTQPAVGDTPELGGNARIQKDILAVYDAVVDPQAGTFEITKVEREGSYHFPLSTVSNVVQITGYGFTPNFWADIKLVHPYPGSGIDCYDPRVIAVFPARPGVSFYYPIFNYSYWC